MARQEEEARDKRSYTRHDFSKVWPKTEEELATRVRERRCAVCGKPMNDDYTFQVYCSYECRNVGCHYKLKASQYRQQIRFECANCGKTIVTENGNDKRSRFCCKQCEKSYWKHPPQDNPHSAQRFSNFQRYANYEKWTNEHF